MHYITLHKTAQQWIVLSWHFGWLCTGVGRLTVVREPATLTLELKSLGIIRWISLNSVYCVV